MAWLSGALSLVGCLLVMALAAETPDEASMDVPQMIRTHGYPMETHRVISDGGYVITLHRIPAGKPSRPGDVNKPPALLQHGILLSSAAFVDMGPGRGLGYVLSDRGYDVWLANARGNCYSSNHIKMARKNPLFWDFSWHEMGVHDLPNVIDYVLKVTGKTDLFYFGHSMGSAMMFVMLHEKPAYNRKVRAMFGLGPAAYMHNGKSPVSNLVFMSSERYKRMFQAAGIHELLPREPMWRLLASALCTDSSPTYHDVCTMIFSMTFGFNTPNLNKSVIPINLGHFPAGTSRKAAAHFGQAILSGEFRHFDDGKEMNLLRYGTEAPPIYNLSRTRIPVNLYCGLRDLICDCKDVERLYNELTNAKPKSFTRIPKYTHMDFLWGMDAHTNLYHDIIKKMDKLL